MFIPYSTQEYSNIKEQHNIMVLVGNGFDIAALNKFGTKRMDKKNTSYADFFDYVTYFERCDPNNSIYKKMKEDKDNQKDNWSDFENSIDELLNRVLMSRSNDLLPCLEKDLDELQECFTEFLNELVTTEVLLKLNQFSMRNKSADISLSKFLGDLQPGDMIQFIENTNHYDLYNFLFVNFNYTSILDNYIFLDKSQFDPHKYKTTDRNFTFYPNPEDKLYALNSNIKWSSYVLTNVIHPHGVQSIPRSMIFGTELDNYNKSSSEKRFVKSFWAQDDLKYKKYFDNVELFIIYGMSLSKTDSWWLDNIYESLLIKNSELIIYYYGTNTTVDDIKKLFINSCIKHTDSNSHDQVKEKIYVVRLENNENYFLGFREENHNNS